MILILIQNERNGRRKLTTETFSKYSDYHKRTANTTSNAFRDKILIPLGNDYSLAISSTTLRILTKRKHQSAGTTHPLQNVNRKPLCVMV